jgi:hypothetical protein
MKKWLFLALLISSHGVLSQATNMPVGVCKKQSIRVLPIGYYTPETRIAAGGLFYYMFCFTKGDTLTRRSSIQHFLTFTLNRQFLAELDWFLYANEEKYIFYGDMDYSKFPELFYGIGNNSSADSAERYSFNRYKLSSKNLKRIGNKFFGGVQYNLQYLYNIEKEHAKMMTLDHIPGSNGFFVHGLGSVFVFDSRNNILNSSKGAYIELAYSISSKFLGSGYDYHNLILDVRKYVTLHQRVIFAVNGYSNFNFGELPYRVMPVLGGARFMRGYYSGRFRDNNMMVLNAEFRFDLFWRIGIAVFSGVGRVSHTLKEFGEGNWKYDVGGGIRFKINRKENVNVRLDYGYTGDSHGLYVVFAEAF